MTYSEPKNQFEKWALGFSGCDGGDIGSPESRSIWICGLEWGGGHSVENLLNEIQTDVSRPSPGYGDWQHQIGFPFNLKTFKLLAAIEGAPVAHYRTFAEQRKPFVRGSHGYFKMNLHPIGFKNVDPRHWQESFSSITGCDDKLEYLAWCRSHRYPEIQKWVSTYDPKLIICFGKTNVSDFVKAFLDENAELKHEVIEERSLSWARTGNDTIVAITHHPIGRWGLNKDVMLQKIGTRLSELISKD